MTNSHLIESVARDRHAERYRRSRSAAVTASRAGTASQRGTASRETPALESTRTRAGWLLVGLGFRLISSPPLRGETAARRARLIGQ